MYRYLRKRLTVSLFVSLLMRGIQTFLSWSPFLQADIVSAVRQPPLPPEAATERRPEATVCVCVVCVWCVCGVCVCVCV